MPRLASLYLPNLSTDRVRREESGGRRESSSPAFRGRGGTQAEGLGGEGLARLCGTDPHLPSLRDGPLLSRKDGRGARGLLLPQQIPLAPRRPLGP